MGSVSFIVNSGDSINTVMLLMPMNYNNLTPILDKYKIVHNIENFITSSSNSQSIDYLKVNMHLINELSNWEKKSSKFFLSLKEQLEKYYKILSEVQEITDKVKESKEKYILLHKEAHGIETNLIADENISKKTVNEPTVNKPTVSTEKVDSVKQDSKDSKELVEIKLVIKTLLEKAVENKDKINNVHLKVANNLIAKVNDSIDKNNFKNKDTEKRISTITDLINGKFRNIKEVNQKISSFNVPEQLKKDVTLLRQEIKEIEIDFSTKDLKGVKISLHSLEKNFGEKDSSLLIEKSKEIKKNLKAIKSRLEKEFEAQFEDDIENKIEERAKERVDKKETA
jgi:hypothetical protein